MNIEYRGELIWVINNFKLPKIAVEVGVAEGRFSKELLDSGFEQLYLVDVWEQIPFIDGCASFENEWHNENYKNVVEQFGNDKRVTILKGFSHKMAKQVPDNSLGLVYIDSAHDYQSVKADIKIWIPKLVEGGIMAFHDYANPDYGVKRAIIEFTKDESIVNIINEDGKPENIGAWIQKR